MKKMTLPIVLMFSGLYADVMTSEKTGLMQAQIALKDLAEKNTQNRAQDAVQDVRPVVDPFYASQLEMYEEEDEQLEQPQVEDEDNEQPHEQLGPEGFSDYFSEVGTETIEL